MRYCKGDDSDDDDGDNNNSSNNNNNTNDDGVRTVECGKETKIYSNDT